MGVRIGKKDQHPPCPSLRVDWELSAHVLISFLAATWKGWAALTMHLHSHVCSSPSRALEAGVACPPHALNTHISSLPSTLFSRPGIPIEEVYRKVSYVLPGAAPHLLSVGLAPFL